MKDERGEEEQLRPRSRSRRSLWRRSQPSNVPANVEDRACKIPADVTLHRKPSFVFAESCVTSRTRLCATESRPYELRSSMDLEEERSADAARLFERAIFSLIMRWNPSQGKETYDRAQKGRGRQSAWFF